MVVAFAFAAGDIAGLLVHPGSAPVLAIAAGISLCLAGLHDSNAASVRSEVSLVAAFVLWGYAAGAHYAIASVDDCRARMPDGARLAGQAVIDGLDEPGARVVLHIEQVRMSGRIVPCAVSVHARLPPSRGRPKSGTVAQARTRQGVRHVAFEGQWWSHGAQGPWPRAPERSGTLSLASVRTAGTTHHHPVLAIRQSALRTVHHRFGAESALAESLLLARRESLDDEVRSDFATAGLAHLLAISGAHVGILAAIVLLLARIARFGTRGAAMASAFVAVGYVVFLGAPAAAARAAVQTIALLVSRLAQRPADPLACLSAAGLALVGARPESVLEPGFQLSFAGVFGLIAFAPPIAGVLPRRLPAWLRSALAPTLGATAATAPIAAWHFGLVSLVGPISNLVAAPLLALAVPAMAAAIVAGVLGESAGSFFGGGAQILLHGLRTTAHAFASIPHAAIWMASDSVTAALLAGMAALAVGPVLRRPGVPHREPRERRLRLRTVLRLAFAGALLVLFPALRPNPGALEIHAIDVGQGDAFAIRTPHDRWLLIDAGPLTPTFDAGRDRIAPYLRRAGVHRIDLIVLSHPHADHIGGVESLWRSFDVGAILDPAVPAAEDLYLKVIADAAVDGRRWLAGRSGRELRIDDVSIRILAPEDSLLDRLTDPNDFSVVVRIEYGRFAALFMGDAPRSVENRLVDRYGDALAADVLKVGHHGSRTSTGDSLLDSVRPGIALVSVGRRNRYGHPSPLVIDRLQRHGIRIVRTDRDGSVIVRARADGRSQLLSVR